MRFSPKRLRELRLAAAISQTELARAARVDPSTVFYLEEGKRQPSDGMWSDVLVVLRAELARRKHQIERAEHLLDGV